MLVGGQCVSSVYWRYPSRSQVEVRSEHGRGDGLGQAQVRSAWAIVIDLVVLRPGAKPLRATLRT